jgi:hypothetical protein
MMQVSPESQAELHENVICTGEISLCLRELVMHRFHSNPKP